MEPIAAESLTDRTARATAWRVAAAAVGAVLQLAVGALLARLLTPADFGVMALAFVVLALARPFGDLGIGGALVQRADLTDRHVRTAFTFSVLLGVGIAIVMVAAAPLGALALNDRRVTSVLRVLSLGSAIGSTAVVGEALLRRQLDFRRKFFIDIGSYVLGYGGVTITLALAGHGVWSLVWGGLAQALLASGAQLAVVRHSVRPLLAGRELSELLHFGLGAAASSTVNYVALYGDNFVVGRWLGAASLGLYSRAYSLMNLPFTYGASLMTAVLFPAFAELQGEPTRVRRGYLLMTRITAMIAAPSMGIMGIAAPHLIRSLYGPQWTGAVGPLQILCVAGYFRALYHLDGVVVQSVGWVYGELWRQAVYAGLVIVGALAGSYFDLAGVAAGVCMAILYMFVAMGQLALRASGTPWRLYFSVQIGGLVIAGIVCAVAAFVRILLEQQQASSVFITLAVLAGAAVPWSLGVLWILGEPEFEPLRPHLSGVCVQLVQSLRRLVGPARSLGGRSRT